MPTQCYYVNSDNGIFIKYPSGADMDHINGADNIRKLKEADITPKLTTKQMEENTIFVISAPGGIFSTDPDQLTKSINADNVNIVALSTFVPRPKVPNQKLGSIKIILYTRNMVNSVMAFGIRIQGCLMEPINIRQGYYLKIPQCSYCSKYHQNRTCESVVPRCPNCAQSHRRYECPNKEGPWKCINCHGSHKATSNLCPKRSSLQTCEPLGDFNQQKVLCLFGTIVRPKESFTNTPKLIQTHFINQYPFQNIRKNSCIWIKNTLRKHRTNEYSTIWFQTQ